MSRIALAAALAGLLVVGAVALISRPGVGPAGPTTPSNAPPSSAVSSSAPAASPTPTPTASAAAWHGQILVEHFGNAPDGSEATAGIETDRHRFYLADPNNLTKSGYTEYLPSTPTTGKSSADVSRDGTKVVFQDWTEQSSIYEANIDGTGFQKLTPDNCSCREWDPAFDATATKVVYGHAEGTKAWLEILDLTTQTRTKVAGTDGSSLDNLPESPAWSADSSQIVFVRTTWNGQEASMGLVHYDQAQTPSGASLTTVAVADGTATTLLTGASPLGTIIPGDPFFSPDGTKLLLTDRPYTKMPRDPAPAVYTLGPDGTGLEQVIAQTDSATWTPDGKYILSTINFFRLTGADGTGGGLVDPQGSDNTDGDVGFIYVGFWVGNP